MTIHRTVIYSQIGRCIKQDKYETNYVATIKLDNT